MRVAHVADSLKRLRQSSLEFSAVIDVGIQHSTPVLMQAFPGLHHYLFEPVAEYTPHIHKNYAGLSYDLVDAAVADFDGSLDLKTEKKTRGDEISHSYIVTRETAETRKVQALKLDSYFAPANGKKRGPYFLKIDVEGAPVPLQILSGARDVLKDTAVVMIEMTMDRFMERARFLDNMGFDVWDIWDICDLCYYGDCLWQVDVIFIRRDLKMADADLRPMQTKPWRKELWQSGFGPQQT